MDSIHIDNRFEGANPFHKDGIRKQAQNSYIIFPFCEDDTNIYKFRLDIKFINSKPNEQTIDLEIDWRDEEFNCYRDILYVKNDRSSWELKKGILRDGKTLARLDLMPGETYLALSPKYDLRDLSIFLMRLSDNPCLKTTVIRKTSKGRNVWLISSTVARRKSKKKLLFSARVHPYETAPSYIIEGLIDFLGKHEGKYFVDAYEIYILPMVCPDGVADGCCRLSGLENGVDLSREIDSSDNFTKIFLNLIDDIKPDFYLELHNWMLKDFDGMFYVNALDAIRLLRGFKMNMPEQLRKSWKMGFRYKLLARKPYGLKRYCKKKYNSTVLTLEIPWYNRDVNDMRNIGHFILPTVERLL